MGGWGRMRNVSMSGAWMTTRLTVWLMAFVHVSFTALKKGHRGFATLEGQVVRIARDGFGIEWCEVAPASVLTSLVWDPQLSQQRYVRHPSHF